MTTENKPPKSWITAVEVARLLEISTCRVAVVAAAAGIGRQTLPGFRRTRYRRADVTRLVGLSDADIADATPAA